MKKKHNICLILICIVLILASCAGYDYSLGEEKEEKEDQICIGMCFDSFVIERWEKDRDIFVSTARMLGAEVNVQNANGNIDEQIKQIEYFINKGVDAIVIISIDDKALTDVVRKARNKNIKVVAYDRMISGAGIDLYVSFDNEKVGELMAKGLIDYGLQKKKVIMLQGSNTDRNVTAVNDGFLRVCSENDIEIADSMYAEGWRAEAASDYLYENPDILSEVDGIMCGNDNIASAVIRVLSEKRKAGKIALVGQDADLEACQRIVEGTQNMTVYKPVEEEARAAAVATVSLIKGEEIENLTSISDNKEAINAIVLEPIEVTADNIDSVIIDTGFHLREEVYLNVINK